MSPRSSNGWFCALLDDAPEVYFRYARYPRRGFVYVSPAVRALTGRPASEFLASAALCADLLVPEDRGLLRRILRSRRPCTLVVHILRDGVTLPVELRTVALVRGRRILAVEGVACLARAATGALPQPGTVSSAEPTQARLAALMYEVHDLLHRVLPRDAGARQGPAGAIVRLGALSLDLERLTVTDSDRQVALTARETLVLRYLMQRPGRIVTREQLLTDVWGYRYTGDARTVDVHMSRLRRKLPSLRERLTAIRNVGYRVEDAETRESARDARRVANS